MKRTTTVALVIVLSATAAPSVAQECYSGQMGFQELTYTDEQDLRREYCYAYEVPKKYKPTSSTSARQSSRYADYLQGCLNYATTIGKVLKKDHGVDWKKIKCK